jgi:hypothetical protein
LIIIVLDKVPEVSEVPEVPEVYSSLMVAIMLPSHSTDR